MSWAGPSALSRNLIIFFLKKKISLRFRKVKMIDDSWNGIIYGIIYVESSNSSFYSRKDGSVGIFNMEKRKI